MHLSAHPSPLFYRRSLLRRPSAKEGPVRGRASQLFREDQELLTALYESAAINLGDALEDDNGLEQERNGLLILSRTDEHPGQAELARYCRRIIFRKL